MSNSNSEDYLGLKPFGEATKIAVQGFVDGVGAFLSRICLPVAKELGLYFADTVRHWRKGNAESVLKKAEAKLTLQGGDSNLHIHPRMALNILEEASWIDDPYIQDAWAGLLASSCTEDGRDDSNLVFVNLLAELTSTQVKILNFACLEAEKEMIDPNGFTQCCRLEISLNRLIQITEISDINSLDFQLDTLRYKGLLQDGGFYTPGTMDGYASIQPTSLALNLYVRGQGSRLSPAEYFRLSINTPPTYLRRRIE